MGRGERLGLAIVGGVAALLVAGAIGFVIGHSRDQQVDASTPTTAAAQTTAAAPAASPTLGSAIGTQGAVLAPGDNHTIAGTLSTNCKTLVSASDGGDCGQVVAGTTSAIWTVDGQPTLGPAGQLAVHVFVYSTEAGGWVERMSASGGSWQSIRVSAADLTGDGKAELLVGYRGPAEADRLEVDIVGFSEDGTPEVLADLDPAAKGSVVVQGQGILRYAAQYPNGEPVCCPPTYEESIIGYEAGSFRIAQALSVSPSAVPTRRCKAGRRGPARRFGAVRHAGRLRAAARLLLSPEVYDFCAGGAGDEWTLRENRAAWSRWRLRPRYLVGVAERSTSTTVLGTPVAFPSSSPRGRINVSCTPRERSRRRWPRSAPARSWSCPRRRSTSSRTWRRRAPVPSGGSCTSSRIVAGRLQLLAASSRRDSVRCASPSTSR